MAALLNAGLDTLSAEQRAKLEIPILAATVAELEAEKEKLKQNIEVLDFSHLHSFCFFIGYPRSGHSLIGSLLDAHEHMCIAHELNLFGLLSNTTLSTKEIFQLILKNSKLFAAIKNVWGVYRYHVKGQHQGSFSKLKVIGDKKGGASTQILAENPQLLSNLHNQLKLPIKIIHVVRNPFDNIATIHKKSHPSLAGATKFYSSLCEANEVLSSKLPSDIVLHVKHEKFLENPKQVLNEICLFLNVEATDDYLEACIAILNSSPNRSRDSIIWPVEIKQKINGLIQKYDYLSDYGFD